MKNSRLLASPSDDGRILFFNSTGFRLNLVYSGAQHRQQCSSERVGESQARRSRSLAAGCLAKLQETIRKCSDVVKDCFTDETHRVERTLSCVRVPRAA